ncbi:hypothetical protein Scep_017245 [Stephania cephalantha]|uniref:Uncharacterized protein n=1 Tax=Stephania cephalantha TaxID=152367 RepID=A0AAP0NTD8_9MAGN
MAAYACPRIALQAVSTSLRATSLWHPSPKNLTADCRERFAKQNIKRLSSSWPFSSRGASPIKPSLSPACTVTDPLQSIIYEVIVIHSPNTFLVILESARQPYPRTPSSRDRGGINRRQAPTLRAHLPSLIKLLIPLQFLLFLSKPIFLRPLPTLRRWRLARKLISHERGFSSSIPKSKASSLSSPLFFTNLFLGVAFEPESSNSWRRVEQSHHVGVLAPNRALLSSLSG